MKKLSFTEKNNFVLRHKGAKHFSPDLDLFRRTFLTHKLNTELARANLHTYDRLDGQMLYILLDALPPDHILANRNGTLPATDEAKTSAPEAENPVIVEELKTLNQLVDDLEKGIELNSDDLSGLRSMLDDSETPLEGLQATVEELEKKAFNKKKARGKSSQP